MNKRDKFAVRWVGRCKYDQHDKIWGWFFNNPESKDNAVQTTCHVFWARTGKSVSFKTHSFNKWEMKRLISNKESKGYVSISVDELEKLWPSFFDDLENRFVLHVLRQD